MRRSSALAGTGMDVHVNPHAGEDDASHQNVLQENWSRNWRTWIPGVSMIASYNVRKQLLSDVIAATAVALLLIPQAIAYADVAQLDVREGLLSAWPGMVAYAMLGTGRDMQIGPTGVISLIVAHQADGDINKAVLQCFLCGLLQFAFGLLGFGFLASFFSRPVLRGFTLYAAIEIMCGQLHHMVGYPVANDPFHAVIDFFGSIGQMSWVTLGFAMSSFVLLLAVDWWRRRVDKETQRMLYLALTAKNIIVIIVFTLVVAIWSQFDIDNAPVAIVGSIPEDIDPPSFPSLLDWDNIVDNLQAALMLAVLAYTEGITVASVFAQENGYAEVLDGNQELVALGMGNVVTGLFGGFAVGGSFSRTSVANDAGATSTVAGMLASVLILIFVYVGTPLIVFVPKSVVASVICIALMQLVSLDFGIEAFALGKHGRLDLGLFVVTFAVMFALGLELGIQVAIAINLLVTLMSHAAPRFTESRMEITSGAEVTQGLLVFRLTEQLDYLGSRRFRRKVLAGINCDEAAARKKRRASASIYDDEEESFMQLAAESLLMSPEEGAPSLNGRVNRNQDRKKSWSAQHLLFDCTALKYVDLTALEVLGELAAQCQRADVSVAFVNPSPRIAELLQLFVVHYNLHLKAASALPLLLVCHASLSEAREAIEKEARPKRASTMRGHRDRKSSKY